MSAGLLSPVAVGVYAKLNVAGLTALVTGVYDNIPQGTAFPYVWYDLGEENGRGLGRGGLRQFSLRVSAASSYAGAQQLQTIMAKVVELLEDANLTIAGCAQAGEVVYHETTEPFESVIAGVQCRESAAHFTIWAEAT